MVGSSATWTEEVLEWLVQHRYGDTTVSTGRGNGPARALYERLGFSHVNDREVIPGLWVTQYLHVPS
jgi:ribosomal protein S18 acetylase RimI-like enzyme